MTGVFRGRDVFGVLSTGFGKSLCFACLPGVYGTLYQTIDCSGFQSANRYHERSGEYKNTLYKVLNHIPLYPDMKQRVQTLYNVPCIPSSVACLLGSGVCVLSFSRRRSCSINVDVQLQVYRGKKFLKKLQVELGMDL